MSDKKDDAEHYEALAKLLEEEGEHHPESCPVKKFTADAAKDLRVRAEEVKASVGWSRQYAANYDTVFGAKLERGQA